MVEISVIYEGRLHCSARHEPSGDRIATDAPVDNNGKGEAFSPTDLVAAAIGSCMSTVMGIVARRKDIDLAGMTVSVKKHMSDTLPRRISKLELDLNVPLPGDHPDRKMLEATANSCPVAHSLHPDVEIVMSWTWQ